MRANYAATRMNTRRADFAIRVTRARGSSKLSIPSETVSCCVCADAGVLALSFRGMAGSRIKVNGEMLTGDQEMRAVECNFLFREDCLSVLSLRSFAVLICSILRGARHITPTSARSFLDVLPSRRHSLFWHCRYLYIISHSYWSLAGRSHFRAKTRLGRAMALKMPLRLYLPTCVAGP
jgi:hypothetical protein